MTDNHIQLPQTVMLIDAVWLNQLIIELKGHFEDELKRPLQDMDMAQFIVGLALDASTSVGKEIQVILVYDESTPKISFCTPSALATELNGVAFQDDLGEFTFASVSPEGMTSREDLYFDLLNLIGEAAEVKNVIIAPCEESDQADIAIALQEFKEKSITLFSINEPQSHPNYNWQQLAYPIMQALGIKGEEV